MGPYFFAFFTEKYRISMNIPIFSVSITQKADSGSSPGPAFFCFIDLFTPGPICHGSLALWVIVGFMGRSLDLWVFVGFMGVRWY